MDAIQSQMAEVLAHWGKAVEAARAAPQLATPYLHGTSLEVLTEAVDTAASLLNRVRAPNGFGPVFLIAKAYAATSLAGLVSQSQQLEAGQFQQLPTFTIAIVNLLSALHTLSIFSQKQETDTILQDLSIQVSQALAVLGTAQSELANKLDQLEHATALANQVSESHKAVKKAEEDSATSLDATNANKEASAEALSEVSKSIRELDQLKSEAQTLVQSTTSLEASSLATEKVLKALNEKSEKQQSVIDSILPKGASAGLAAAFATRGGNLNLTKYLWILAFVGTVFALALFAFHLSTLTTPPNIGYWQFVLYKVTLAGPMIWLGWFSAVQYGNTIRVQEDYAFKEATSIAFQGYRDHFQYLASIDDTGGGTAMILLAKKTIEILALEPLRIYNRVHHDASPMQTIAALFRRPKETEHNPAK